MSEEMAPEERDEIVEGEIVEGEIVNGTWINPAIAADDPRRRPVQGSFSYTLPEGRPSFARMIFGSVVILTDEVTERASIAGDDDAPRQMVEAAIRQAAEQERAIDRRPFADLRYATIGLVGGALDSAQGGAGRLSNLSDGAVHAASRIISPVWNSFLFRPLHAPAKRAEQAGEAKVDEWIRRGRVEEVRSRALAEVSLNNLVEESVSELTTNQEVQMLVQQVIASQSTSMVTEILNEARERLVSLDMLLMGMLRRPMVAAPDFRQAYIRELGERRSQHAHLNLAGSMAGTFAGPVSRLVAFLLDVIILLIAVGLMSAFASSTLNLFGLTDVFNTFLQSGSMLATATVFFLLFFNFLVISVYFVISWNWTGSSVGNTVFGLRVVNREGGRVSVIRSILRLIGAYFSAVIFLLGFIWALFDGRRQGWHDKFGATFVLYDWPAKPEERFLNAQVRAELAEEGRRSPVR